MTTHVRSSIYTNSFFSDWFLKNKNIFPFPIVKINANYAENCRVGNLEAGFQHVPPVQFL